MGLYGTIGHNTASRNFLELVAKEGFVKQDIIGVLADKSLSEIEEYLGKYKNLSEERIVTLFSQFYGLKVVDLSKEDISKNGAKIIPQDIAQKYNISPYKIENFVLHVAVGDPATLQQNPPMLIASIHRKYNIQLVLELSMNKSQVMQTNQKIYGNAKIDAKPISAPTPTSTSAPEAPKVELIRPSVVLSKQKAVERSEPRKIKPADLSRVLIPQKYLKKIPKDVAVKYKIICFGETIPKSTLEVPMIKIGIVDPANHQVNEILGFIETKSKNLIDRHLISQADFDKVLKQYDPLPVSATPVAPIEISNIEPSPIKPTEPAHPVTPKNQKDITLDQKAEDKAEHKSEPKSEAKPELPTKPNANVVQNQDSYAKAVTKEPSYISLANESVELSDNDIVNQPSSEADNAELQRLMKEQDTMLENQNIGQLLKSQVNDINDLSVVMKRGFIPEIVAATMSLAIKTQASDIHIEAQNDCVRIRFRVDGILHDIAKIPKFLHAPLVSRIKILAKLKIDEQRVPQDGRFDVTIENRQVDVRVSTLPTVHGEKIVMRLLDKSSGVLSLEQLGVTGTNFDILVKNINKPFGIILSTGPTGSGKSTTLYAALTRISKPGINIITLEDPVEYELTGINQVQVKPQIGFTFAEGLRSVLRQDPNVIMVGEIRDLETAALATHAALTGHLVLSTLHTNDAAGALPRLINMGVEPFLITSSINAVIGQRLVRKICDHCKKPADVPPPVLSYAKKIISTLPSGQLKEVNVDQMQFYHGVGCANCNAGYKGRIGIFEVLSMCDEIEELAVAKRPTSDIQAAAVKNGMITMIQDGLLKALKGITTIDEVLRVTTTNIKELPGG